MRLIPSISYSRVDKKVRWCGINSSIITELLHSILPHKTDYLRLEHKTQDQVRNKVSLHPYLPLQMHQPAQRFESLLSTWNSFPLLLPFRCVIKSSNKRSPVTEVDEEGWHPCRALTHHGSIFYSLFKRKCCSAEIQEPGLRDGGKHKRQQPCTKCQ